MFLDNFNIVLKATAEVFLMASFGFFLVKKKVLNKILLEQFSKILIDYLFPFFIFIQLLNKFTFEKFSNWPVFPLISFVISILGIFLGALFFKFKKSKNNKKEFYALLAFQNGGNIPLVLVASMFTGVLLDEMLIKIFVFLIGFNLTMWSIGVVLIDGKPFHKIDLKHIFNAPLIAILLAFFFISFKLKPFIPTVLFDSLETLSSCYLPFAILIVGGNLASISIRKINKPLTIGLVLLKLVLMPLLAILFVKYFNLGFVLGFIIVLESAMPSAMSLSIISRYLKVDDEFVSQGIFFTHVFSIVTVPIFITIFMFISNK